ncbi:hypothetical protein R1flu_007990 [Riccia fluitans]|uniref:Uncharacterized protein n=1 Tax=Riccia fluitans TaxID=41844 RepID=A0ABD1YAM1_9MARC
MNRSAIPPAFYHRSDQGLGVTRLRTLSSPRSGGVSNSTVKCIPSDAPSREAEPSEGVACQPTLHKSTFSPNTNYSGNFTDAEEGPETDGIESMSPAVRRYRQGKKGPLFEGKSPTISDSPPVAELAAGYFLANSPQGPAIRDQSFTNPDHTPDFVQKTEHTTREIRNSTLGLPAAFNFMSLLLSTTHIAIRRKNVPLLYCEDNSRSWTCLTKFLRREQSITQGMPERTLLQICDSLRTHLQLQIRQLVRDRMQGKIKYSG